MSAVSWVVDKLFEGGRELVKKAQRFSRTRTPEQQREELEAWDRNHMPIRGKVHFPCAVCGKPRAADYEHCPGPTKPWKPPNAATKRCKHDGTAYLPGCVICDPRAPGKAVV